MSGQCGCNSPGAVTGLFAEAHVTTSLNDSNLYGTVKLQPMLNPTGVKAPKPLALSITNSFTAKLHSPVVQDLRAGASGRRAHLWTGMSCMVVYTLNPNWDMLRLMLFSELDDEEVDADVKWINSLVSESMWIYIPPASGACAQVSDVPLSSLFSLMIRN